MYPIVIKWALSHPWTSTLVVDTVEPGLRATVLLSAEYPSSLLTKANRHRILEDDCSTRTTCEASPVSVTVSRTSLDAVLTLSTCTTVEEEEPLSATQPLVFVSRARVSANFFISLRLGHLADIP